MDNPLSYSKQSLDLDYCVSFVACLRDKFEDLVK